MLSGQNYRAYAVVALGWLAVGGILTATVGGKHQQASTVAVAMFGLATIVIHTVIARLIGNNHQLAILEMVLGLIIRGATAIGVGSIIYFGTPWFEGYPLTFWLWVATVYMSFMAVNIGRLIVHSYTAG